MEKNWFKDWFASEDYLKVYNHRDSKDAQNLSDLIIKNVNPKPNDLILDSACGAGRHGIYLASKNINVIGFDLSMTLLLKAKEDAERNNTKIQFIQADIREITFRRKIFAVLNLFTSFGYFNTDEENFRFVKHSFEFLNDGGFYVIDYFNKNYLLENLVPESNRIIDDLSINEKRIFQNDRIVKKIILNRNGEKKEFLESVRLYGFEDIITGFSCIGFKVHKIFGNYNGAEYDEDKSPRLIIIFNK